MAAPDARLGLAVSGGADSVALLLLARAAFPDRIEAASVDHGLRSESAGEARIVAALCADRGVPHAILHCSVAPGNLQDRARRARYAALGEWAADRGLAAIATAHHADDQAETLMMRLNRGSGLSGLAGVRAATVLPGGLPLIRPLLGWRRTELAGLVAQAGIEPVRDPSNDDPRFDRARMRLALQDFAGLDPKAMARSAAHLAEAERTLDAFAEREWAGRVRRDGSVCLYRPEGPALIRKLVVRRIIAALGGDAGMAQVENLVEALERGRTATLSGVVARSSALGWHFAAEPPRRSG